ncbi:MAG: hypothetical protein KZQ78_11315, partial [Candidatus Thiodiazotropha sp. (ex Ustalcina ferruginea)]|nr:hypothetical protein [Candidatus Thiodiazotropha sp. (ex Ustalcina ferruginea)]
RDFFIVDSPFRNHNWKILLLNPVIFWGDYPPSWTIQQEDFSRKGYAEVYNRVDIMENSQ